MIELPALAFSVQGAFSGALKAQHGFLLAPATTVWCEQNRAAIRCEFVGAASSRAQCRVSGSYELDSFLLTQTREPALLLGKGLEAASNVVDRAWDETWGHAICDYLVRA